jgi:glycogen(starch) synthase
MRILMLSWEYPPRIVGGIARHVEELSEALAKAGHEIHVVTANHPDTLEHALINGVHVHRVKSLDYETPDFLSWVLQLNLGLVTYALELAQKTPFDLIQAHDWLVSQAGIALKKGLALPMVGTIHATEMGRNKGTLHTAFSKYVHQMEWLLCFESWRVIVCSNYMEKEVRRDFALPADKLDIIPNGINASKFDFAMSAHEKAEFRRQFAADNQKIVFFVGRMTPEKGAQILLEAVPAVLHEYHDARFVFVGKGGFLPDLQRRAHELGVSPYVKFTGFVSDEDLLKLYHVVDVAIFPSLYEPFGIVALEGMAAGIPTIVSDTGGLGEIVEHGKSGLTVFPGEARSIAWGITEVLKNPATAKSLSQNARKRVEKVFNWDLIAKSTSAVYERILSESAPSEVKAVPPKVAQKR